MSLVLPEQGGKAMQPDQPVSPTIGITRVVLLNQRHLQGVKQSAAQRSSVSATIHMCGVV
jgi:hypothetical protein